MTETPPWDLNQAYTCGRLWCSNVHIYDDTANLRKTLLTPEFTGAALKQLNQPLEVTKKLEGRAKLIEGVFNNIVLNILEKETIEEEDYIEDNLRFWLPRTLKKLFDFSQIKPYHPWTPRVEIGIRNNHTVIYTPEQFDLGIPAQTIVTVTKIDAKANRTTVDKLAQNWQKTIRLSFSTAFLSRNLLEDMLNSILILWTDRYAIGDVIDINGMGGLVESINLCVTSLRKLDGQVIAIPNSRISTVVHHTKYWSRVNFPIKIAWHKNIKKAIEIMKKVAHKMQSESTWSKKFLEPLEVLGVDELSHEGILIHVLIKTKPSEHWSIGRELRLRVKEAFDEENMTLGIPHHTVSLINKSHNDDQLLSYIVPEQDN